MAKRVYTEEQKAQRRARENARNKRLREEDPEAVKARYKRDNDSRKHAKALWHLAYLADYEKREHRYEQIRTWTYWHREQIAAAARKRYYGE